jgi:hypothetical protein
MLFSDDSGRHASANLLQPDRWWLMTELAGIPSSAYRRVMTEGLVRPPGLNLNRRILSFLRRVEVFENKDHDSVIERSPK